MGIEVCHMSKSFGGFSALRDVSLRVEPGRLVALLGPSGCGKTTLLRIIAGLETPDAGSGPIRFQDEDVRARNPRERGVGFVFQHYALFRHMTVFENIAFGLRVKPRGTRPPPGEIRQRVLELLRLIQMEAQADRYPMELSGGQRQRVALARALAVRPSVLLLDEPFGALDAQVRQELRRWLRRLHEEIRVTSVFVTHDQEEALEIADEIVVMNAGRIEQIGSPEAVFQRPASEFVMRFLGHVNFFHGRVQDGRVTLAGGAAVSAETQDVRLFARPHDLEISRHPPTGAGAPWFAATVRHVRAAGAQVKVDLVRDGTGDELHVVLSHERQRVLGVAEGERVCVGLREYHVFDPGAAAGSGGGISGSSDPPPAAAGQRESPEP